MSTPTRVLLVDDHPVVRRGVRALLQTEADMDVAGEVEDAPGAVDAAISLAPDVVLMDLVLGRTDGVEAIRRIKSARPDIAVLVLTSFMGSDRVQTAMDAGADGYLLKDCGAAELVAGIRKVSPRREQMGRDRREGSPEGYGQPDEPLTTREIEVLGMIATGASNKEIARSLGVTYATVRTHVSHIMAKLRVPSRTRAALYALRSGLGRPDDS